MRIVEGSPGDAETLLELQRLAYRSEAEIYNDDRIAPLLENLETKRAAMKGRTVLNLVDEDGRLQGSVMGWLDPEGVCHIERLMVHPHHQGQGYGRRLLETIEKRFGQARKYALFTGSLSARNLRLYQTAGYRETNRRRETDKVELVDLEKPGPRAADTTSSTDG